MHFIVEISQSNLVAFHLRDIAYTVDPLLDCYVIMPTQR